MADLSVKRNWSGLLKNSVFIYFILMKYLITPTLLLTLGLSACIYEPEPFEGESRNTTPAAVSSEIGTVHVINEQNQICNPSVSQDMKNYPAAMLWLNFSGDLNVDPGKTGFDPKGADDHDRLTVTDKSGKVLWYMMKGDAPEECEFQDPEWSTHANFIVATLARDSLGKKNCDHKDYGVFAARMSDKKRFWFAKSGYGEFTTPHVWVDPSVTDVDTSASDSTVKGFFGTDNVRLVLVDLQGEIVFVDYANGGMKKAVKLQKSSEMVAESWFPDSPLISPDGNFIVYNALKSKGNSTVMKSYVQKLSSKSAPVEIEASSGAMGVPLQPHWFKYGEKMFVTWAEVPDNVYFIKSDFSQPSAQDGSVGRTVMREISLDGNASASDLAIQWVGDVREIAPIPTTGGRTSDGMFLATGYQYGFMLELP